METKKLENALALSLRWFEHSGIMRPFDGSWGVAERIFTGQDDELRRRIKNNFNSFTPCGDAMVVEARRPDCNFQLAWLELCAGKLFGKEHHLALAYSLLEFLYCRSGMLSRGCSSPLAPVGVWNWSHTQWRSKVFFDDNSWCLMLGCMIAREKPEWAECFEMTAYNAALAKALAVGLERCLNSGEPILSEDSYDPQSIWWGRVFLPHFGGLAAAALAVSAAYMPELENEVKMHQLVRRYMKYVASAIDTFNSSELAYALLSASVAWMLEADKVFFGELAQNLAARLLAKTDPRSGNIPAEHYEAPRGTALMDFIYTINWALLALQQYSAVSNDEIARKAFEKLLRQVVDLQDKSDDKRFTGCWRGMYDLEHHQWGGGSVIEGGADSIYSGWTNVPIALAIAGEIAQRPLVIPCGK